MNKRETKKPSEVRFNASTGELFTEDESGRELNELVERGFAVEVRFNERSIYLMNPYIVGNKDRVPNDTLLRIFSDGNYCRRCDCEYFAFFEDRKEFCDSCKYRIAINKEEIIKGDFKDRVKSEKFTSYFKAEDILETNQLEQPMTYRQYLKADYWMSFRQKALEYYNNTCDWCSATSEESTLHVHHVRYGEWFDEQLEDVILLCANCHSKAHGKNYKKR